MNEHNPVWMILSIYIGIAITIIVPIGITVDRWLEKRHQRREFLRSIIWRV